MGRRSGTDRRSFLRLGALGGAAVMAGAGRDRPLERAAAAGRRERRALGSSGGRRARRRLRVARGRHRRAPPPLRERGAHRCPSHRALSGADRGARPRVAQRARDQPRCARHRPRARSGTQGGPGARPAPRHSGPAQGQHRHRRPDEDDGRLAGAEGRSRRATRRWRAAARGGRGDPRQDQPQRVGELPRPAVDQRLERPRRPDPQSVRAGPQPCGSARAPASRRRRASAPSRSAPRPTARSSARRQQRGGRHQAHGRTGQPRRHHPDLAQPGHRRTDGAHRRRRGRGAVALTAADPRDAATGGEAAPSKRTTPSTSTPTACTASASASLASSSAFTAASTVDGGGDRGPARAGAEIVDPIRTSAPASSMTPNRGPALRVQGRHRGLPRDARSGARPTLSPTSSLQRGEPRARDAVVRPGALPRPEAKGR